jgi:hypothetical protein
MVKTKNKNIYTGLPVYTQPKQPTQRLGNTGRERIGPASVYPAEAAEAETREYGAGENRKHKRRQRKC